MIEAQAQCHIGFRWQPLLGVKGQVLIVLKESLALLLGPPFPHLLPARHLQVDERVVGHAL